MAVAACFSPKFPDNVTCGPGGECPPDQYCTSRVCVPEGTELPDAAPPDALEEPPVPELTFHVQGDLSGCATIPYRLRDAASRRVTLRFEFHPDQGGPSFTMTPAGSDPGEPSLVDVPSSSQGLSHGFHWNTTRDLPASDVSGTVVVHVLASGAPEQTATTHVRVANRLTTAACDPGFGPIQTTAIGAYSGASSDVNADGKTDLVITDGVSVSVLLGRGDGHFQPGGELVLDYAEMIAAADMDSDGDQDFLVTTVRTVYPDPPDDPEMPTPEPVYVAELDIVGQSAGDLYLAASTIMTSTGYIVATTGDIDNDGDQDIIARDGEGSLWTIRNLDPASLAFDHPMRVLHADSTRDAKVADLDGDGVLELVATTQGSLQVFHQLSGAPGVFSIRDVFEVPTGDYPWGFGAIALADVDSDGRTDVLTSAELGGLGIFHQRPAAMGPQLEIATTGATLRQEGVPHWVKYLLYRPDVPSAALVLVGDYAAAWRAGDNSGPTFDTMTGMNTAGDLVPGDFDGDGATDIAILDNHSVSVSLARSIDAGFLPMFTSPPTTEPGVPQSVLSVAIGRFTDSGKLSVAVSYREWHAAMLRIFAPAEPDGFGPWLDFPESAQRLETADVDGNGLDDLVLGAPGLRVRLQGPPGVWSPETPLPGVYDPYYSRPVAADLDRDGHLDIVTIVTTIDSYTVAWLKNLGGTTFEEPRVIMEGYVQGIVVGLLDGDDNPDLVVWDSGRVGVLLQSGEERGRFLPPVFYNPPASNWFGSPVIADIDQDGIADLVVPTWGGDAPGAYLLRGDPASPGSFLPPMVLVPAPAGEPRVLGVGDVDGDHCPDLVVASAPFMTFLQDCSHPGTFPRRIDSINVGCDNSMRIADFDDDGRTDILCADSYAVYLLKGQP